LNLILAYKDDIIVSPKVRHLTIILRGKALSSFQRQQQIPNGNFSDAVWMSHIKESLLAKAHKKKSAWLVLWRNIFLSDDHDTIAAQIL
jgi:hypothetical protein